MASKRRNMFQKNKMQETTENGSLAAPLHHETKKTPQETKHTKNIKKEEPDNDEPFIFKAKPVPVSTYVKDGNNAMNSTRLAKSSVLPNGKRIKIESESLGGTIYDRSTQMMRRKEEKIEKVRLLFCVVVFNEDKLRKLCGENLKP
ncbi:hypothetical protein AAG570_001095 [Ranatra chinensis]|uniref:Uncharacterized protein n=1 Tax=Ranatra chinensis TaxID=642074 RepID=A0ABD0YZ17_9HEMI